MIKLFFLRLIKEFILGWLKIFISVIKGNLSTRQMLIIENTLLKNQIDLLELRLKKEEISKPRPPIVYKQLWVIASMIHPYWKDIRNQVTPATVIKWHRNAFSKHWWKKSQPSGRPPISNDILRAIDILKRENPSLSVEKLREMLLNMFIVGVPSANTLRKYLEPTDTTPNKKPPTEKQVQSWKTFLNNHKDIWAMDFFVVPSIRFKLLYVLIIINHQTRKLEHIGVSSNPDTSWLKQQIREATPYDYKPEYLIHDNDSVFVSEDFQNFLKSTKIKSKRISYRSPWQNGIAERAVGIIRRELTDHIIPIDEKHLYRLLKEFQDYYNNYRTHQGIGCTTPNPSPVYPITNISNTILIPTKVIGGLYTTYKKTA